MPKMSYSTPGICIKKVPYFLSQNLNNHNFPQVAVMPMQWSKCNFLIKQDFPWLKNQIQYLVSTLKLWCLLAGVGWKGTSSGKVRFNRSAAPAKEETVRHTNKDLSRPLQMYFCQEAKLDFLFPRSVALSWAGSWLLESRHEILTKLHCLAASSYHHYHRYHYQPTPSSSLSS